MSIQGITALPIIDGRGVVGILLSREIVDGLARHGSRLSAGPVIQRLQRVRRWRTEADETGNWLFMLTRRWPSERT